MLLLFVHFQILRGTQILQFLNAMQFLVTLIRSACELEYIVRHLFRLFAFAIQVRILTKNTKIQIFCQSLRESRLSKPELTHKLRLQVFYLRLIRGAIS